jgi:hypothetical protein
VGLAIFIVIVSIGPLGGWLLGRPKGLALEGALLGLLLNLAGWIIISIIPPRGQR